MAVVTRFAPSPTGNLHIGSLRTALFNWLYARHNGGTFHVRIEDTDRVRSEDRYLAQIFNSLAWLGLDMDSEPVMQHEKAARHRDVAMELLEKGMAYKCYTTPEELSQLREEQTKQGKVFKYDRRWRDRDPSEHVDGVSPAIRLKLPLEGHTVINDRIKGKVEIANSELDDFVLLRSDGTPTYMLSVVVDDHDLGVTHVIRGDDHFTNTYRQEHIYKAMGWESPEFAHIPLIHDEHGKKLSKRKGATSVNEYIDSGYVPEAFFNFLLRMGWGHGDVEIFTKDEAIALFDINGLGKSPAKFDIKKLSFLGGHFLKAKTFDNVSALLADKLGIKQNDARLSRIEAIFSELTTRADTIGQIAANAKFLIEAPTNYDESVISLFSNTALLNDLNVQLGQLDDFTAATIQDCCKRVVGQFQTKMVNVAMPLRAAVTGQTTSPSIFAICEILGKDEVRQRLQNAISTAENKVTLYLPVPKNG